MIARIDDRSSADRRFIGRFAGRFAGRPIRFCAARRAGETADDGEDTGLLTRTLTVFAERMMSHARAQMREAPERDRICPNKATRP